MAKRKSQKTPVFEDALSELETIAVDLEEGTLGLDESLERFEKGVGLLRHCYSVLENAEGKIAELTGFDAEGNPIEEPFDASATAEQGAAGRRKTSRRRRTKASAPEESNEDETEGGLF